ncbi:MAG: 3-keto-5-aminohexanoate cleavage protein [Candidatus Bathyarchaeia archaeon]
MNSTNRNNKLVITATVAPSWIYPNVRKWPLTPEDVAKEVFTAYEAGASIAHIHGKTKWTTEFYQETFDRIKEKCDIILQMGLSGLTIDERSDLYQTKPEMLSIILNHHDEYFPEAKIKVFHTQEELVQYMDVCKKWGIKPEFEQWHQGSNWNLKFLIDKGLIQKPYVLTVFFGWPGGIWSPPTPEEVLYRFNSLPEGSIRTVSTMDHNQTRVSTMSLLLGGNVRVGYEDNPYYTPDVLAKDLGELVARIKRIGKELNIETADPSEARRLVGIR